MLELKKGDLDNLQGRATVYSKLNYKGKVAEEHPLPGYFHNGIIFAVYISTDILDFSDKLGMPKEELASIGKQIVGDIQKETRGLHLSKKNAVPLYETPTQANEIDLPFVKEDVLFTGEYSNPITCQRSLHQGIELYVLNHFDQLERRYGINTSSLDSDSDVKKHTEFSGDSLRKHIMGVYVGPMMDAINRDDCAIFKSLKRDMVNFGAGSPFIKDILGLCSVIEGSRGTDIVDFHLEKIIAIDTEDYEAAAQLRDKIKEMQK